MTDAAKTDKAPERMPLVELVAVERGFYAGHMVEPGQAFWFDPNPRPNSTTGKPVRSPKWAKASAEAKADLAEKAKKLKAFDTKPKDAQVALKGKQARLSGAE